MASSTEIRARLTELLNDLLSREELPSLDRWFSAVAHQTGWPVADQKVLWDSLRRVMTRAFLICSPSEHWPAFRTAMRGRAYDWARLAEQATPHASLASAGIPSWLTSSFQERRERSQWTADDERRFLSLQETPSPITVRFRYGPDGDACRERMIAAAEVELISGGVYRLTTARGLETTEEWKQGLVEIQDGASQLSLSEMRIRPGMRVWDVCAGNGGKTLLAANELRGKGSLLATDIADGKLRSLKERVRRSRWQNIRILPWDGERLPSFGPENSGKGFDRVIVDAPCTASGTWRRDPDARFRLTPSVLQELIAHQNRLLGLGWQALKPGGKLAYITCSWLPQENEGVVEAFAAQSGAKLVHQELLGLPRFDASTLFVSVLEKA